MSGRRLDIDTHSILSAKDPEYPCQYCANEGREKCGMISCYRWMNWFGRAWRDIRRTFSRFDTKIEPVELRRVRMGVISLKYGGGEANNITKRRMKWRTTKQK